MAPTAADLPHLLLLPRPPTPATRPTLDAAYRPSILAAFTRLGVISTPGQPAPVPIPRTQLIVALTAPILTSLYQPQVRWKYAQSLLAGLYTILAIVCVEHGVEADFGNDPSAFDVRIVLVDHEVKRTYRQEFEGGYSDRNGTTVRNLAAFASSVHPWASVMHPSSEPGYQLLSEYLAYAEGRQTFLQSQIVPVDAGLSLSTGASPPSGISQPGDEALTDAATPYQSICFGGTFDHLHFGHKLLIQATALLVAVPKSAGKSELIIGISADELLKNKKFSEELQSWRERARSVFSLLLTTIEVSSDLSLLPASISADSDDELCADLRDGSLHVRCVAIRDPFGPPIHEQDISAIVLSGETRSGGQAINDKRTKQSWALLDTFEVDVLDTREIDNAISSSKDYTEKISSTLIRQRKAIKKVE